MHKWQIFLLSLFISSRLLAQDMPPLSTACVTPTPSTSLSLDTTLGYAEAIQSYLSTGGDPAQLKPLLQEAGVLPAPDMSDGVYVTDLTDDGINDVVVSIIYPDPPNSTMSTYAVLVFVFICDSTPHFQQVYDFNFTQADRILNPNLLVKYVGDLNLDSHTEMIQQWVSCGASNCFLYVDILGWDTNTSEMRDLLSITFPLGDYVLTDKDGDGIQEVIVKTATGGSAGGGPRRVRTITYAWDGSIFALISDIPEPPTFRFQAAEDAISALNSGDLQTAETLYQRVIKDPTLKDTYSETREIIKSHALFGLLVIKMAQQDEQGAQAAFMALQNAPLISHPSISPPSHFTSVWVEAGNTLFKAAQASDLSVACTVVIAELNSVLDKDSPLSGFAFTYLGQFGYANAWPRPEDVCPF